MSNSANTGDNGPSPYIPAWSDGTPPHGSATPPGSPRTGGRAAARRAASARPRRRHRRIAGAALALLLACGLGAGGWWYLQDEEATSLREGGCLRGISPDDLRSIDCDAGDARYLIVEKFQGSSTPQVCESLPGEMLPIVVTGRDEPVVVCVTPN